MEKILLNNTWVKVKIMQGDGNCLYAASLDQIKKLNLQDFTKWDIPRIRQEVAAFVQCHIKEMKPQLMSTMKELEVIYSNVPMELRLARYIEDLKSNGFWGGEESIAAISNITQTTIKIHQQGAQAIKFEPTNAYKQNTRGTIDLLFRGTTGSINNHYDSIWHFESNKEQKCKQTALDTTTKGIRNIEAKGQKVGLYPRSTIVPVRGFEVAEMAIDSQEAQIGGNTTIKIGTWNVRGCRNEAKREAITEILDQEEVDIACLQETHMTEGQNLSKGYTWFLSGGNHPITYRGTALIIRNGKAIMESFYPINENVAAGKINITGQKISIITAHIPCDLQKARTEIEVLSCLITEMTRQRCPTFIIGDFNAHLGTQDTQKGDAKLIGPMLRHKLSNENGILLKNMIQLHRLTVSTSWSQNKSVLTTWSNGNLESQIDHILSMNHYPQFKVWCKAKWGNNLSDHKLVYAKLVYNGNPRKAKTHATTPNQKWNVECLKDEETRQYYRGRIRAEIEQQTKEWGTESQGGTKPQEEKWARLCGIISEVAGECLNRPTSPMTPRRRKTIAAQKKARFWKIRCPNKKEYVKQLFECNKARSEANKLHEIRKCETFFQNLKAGHPSARMRQTYKFMKQYKRQNRTKSKFIPMAKWEEELKKQNYEARIKIEVSEKGEIPPPLNHDKIREIIHSFKRGTAPGVDRINIELIQSGPEELSKQIIKIMEEAWTSNQIPEAWNHTIQIPIPKVGYPKGTEDYRRVSLCSVAYKIYAKILLDALDQAIHPLPQYQAAFLPDRSTEDHIFTIRRITEEAWNEGRKIYVLALDIARAFASVNHKALVSILKHQGVPTYLINRIVKACLFEESAIHWYGQTTTFYQKTVGVKEGCPISPRLFTIILHEVIETTVEVLRKYDLREKTGISLPMLFAYADDLVVVAEDTQDLEQFMEEVIPNMLSTGMSLNLKKCEVLIRDPKQIENKRKDNVIMLNRNKIKVVQTMRYLGAFLTSSINRKGSTQNRISKAMRAARIVIPFLKKYTPPWNTIRNIYNSMITPVALYGMKATATTRVNRTALKDMERSILALMLQHCKGNKKKGISVLLRGKTIWRRVMNQRIRYWGHIYRRPINHILQVALRIKPAQRRIGRPCFTWMDSLEKDIGTSNIPKPIWETAAIDKGSLKKLAEKLYEIADSSEEEDVTMME